MEMEYCIAKMKTGKTPGLNGIPFEAIKQAAKTNDEWLLEVFKQLWKKKKFAKEWKEFILISKQHQQEKA